MVVLDKCSGVNDVVVGVDSRNRIVVVVEKVHKCHASHVTINATSNASGRLAE